MAAELFDYVPQVVVAVYAHPDDADVACGASLAKWVDLGAAVHLVVLAAGEKGSHDPTQDPAALNELRRDEVSLAAKALGVESVIHLGIPDGEVPEHPGLLASMVRLIRALTPDLVIGHDPTAVYFGSVYVNHRDHRAAGWAVLDAVAPAAAMPLYFPEEGPAHRVRHVLLTGTLEPDCYVEVAQSLERKIEAVAAHRSQLDADPAWVASTVRRRAADDGRVVGVASAEGFRHLELDA